MKFLLLALVIILSGCSPIYYYSNNQIRCQEPLLAFDAPPECFIHDPLLNKQVPIDSNGVITTCSATTVPCTVYLIERTQCYVCQATYTDSMNNTWTGKPYNEMVTPR